MPNESNILQGKSSSTNITNKAAVKLNHFGQKKFGFEFFVLFQHCLVQADECTIPLKLLKRNCQFEKFVKLAKITVEFIN